MYKIRNREFYDPGTKAVYLQSIDSSKKHTEVEGMFAFLENKLGLTNPIMFGGYLRDLRYGEMTNQDISSKDADFIVSSTDGNDLQTFRNHIKSLEKEGVIQDLRIRSKENTSDDHAKALFRFSYNGFSYDVTFCDCPISSEMMGTYGDTTINSIAMGKDGKILGHPMLDNDLKDGLYRRRAKPLTQFWHTKMRFMRLIKRQCYKHFKLVGWDHTKPQTTPVQQNLAAGTKQPALVPRG